MARVRGLPSVFHWAANRHASQQLHLPVQLPTYCDLPFNCHRSEGEEPRLRQQPGEFLHGLIDAGGDTATGDI